MWEHFLFGCVLSRLVSQLRGESSGRSVREETPVLVHCIINTISELPARHSHRARQSQGATGITFCHLLASTATREHFLLGRKEGCGCGGLEC